MSNEVNEKYAYAGIPDGYFDDVVEKTISKGTSGVIDPTIFDEVWKLNQLERGQVIEEILACTEYKDWYNIGATNNGFFPVIDFQKGQKVISVKSIDPRLKSYSGDKATKKIEEYIEKLDVDITVSGKPAQKILDIRIPKGTKDRINLKHLNGLCVDSDIILKIKEF